MRERPSGRPGPRRRRLHRGRGRYEIRSPAIWLTPGARHCGWHCQ